MIVTSFEATCPCQTYIYFTPENKNLTSTSSVEKIIKKQIRKFKVYAMLKQTLSFDLGNCPEHVRDVTISAEAKRGTGTFYVMWRRYIILFFSVVKNYMPGAMGSDLSELLPARN